MTSSEGLYLLDGLVLTALLMILAILMVILAVLVRQRDASRRMLGILRQLTTVVEEPQPLELDDPPVPVDDQMPPRVLKHYKGGRDNLRCVCHKEPLRPDSEIMMIPIDGDPKRQLIYCEREIERLRPMLREQG